MRILWTRLALQDLNSASDYIAENRPSALVSVISRIEQSIHVLQDHPEIGRQGRIAGTRELVIPGTPFIVPYRIKEKRIEILAFIHGARRWPDHL